MSQEQTIISQFNDATSKYWSTHSDYDQVNALLLYWEDDDLNVVEEVTALKALFEDDLKFKVQIFPIPTENAQADLQCEVATFVKGKANIDRSLVIVFYAGHSGDQDQNSEPGYGFWRAKETAGPSLDWFMIQPLLFSARGDVLVILDCCHAALKLRGKKKGKMEILAASGAGFGSGFGVPGPGKLSFTSVLIRQIKRCLKKKEEIGIKWLHAHLWDDKTKPALTVTPVYFDMSENDQRSIVLKPLPEQINIGFTKRKQPPSSFMFLMITLDDDPAGLQIATWLKSFPPRVIQSVDIEGLVLKARMLENLNTQAPIFSGSVLGSLSSAAQTEIIQRIKSLSRTVSTTAALATDPQLTVPTGQLESIDGSKVAEDVISDIQDKVTAVCDSIEGGIALDPRMDLEEAVRDAVVVASGAADAISLRQHLLSTKSIPEDLEIPRCSIKFAPSQRGGTQRSRFRYGVIADRRILVEGFSYTPATGLSGASPETITQMKRMVTHLSLPKSGSFHALTCVGYVKEEHLGRLGVVFDVDTGVNTEELPVLLCDLYPPKRPRVPLGRRIKLAHTLAVTLESFHRVGWVHKEIKSANIAFFQDTTTTKQGDNDLTQPFIFGFECARPEDIYSEMKTDFTPKNNAYRHPERWGKPQRKFEKAHDVYSLGIVLLEIAFWKSIMQFKEMQKGARGETIDPEVIKRELVQRVEDDLPHLVGQTFAEAIVSCLAFKELTVGSNEFQVYQTFNARVVQRLNAASSNL